jgi:Na+/H+ antiporter NhaC
MLGAAISGAIFGDHASPISDTTVLASMASASDHIEHVRTQLPYALIAATIAAVGFLLIGLVQ